MTSKAPMVAGESPRLMQHQYVSGICREMQPVQRLISEIAPTDIPVLLQGESGTGKEIIASRIHSLSRYKELPFTKLSCAALTPELLERKLGTSENGHGENNRFRAGTLFLDEVGELDASCQRRLLHLIPDGNGDPVGQLVACRVISCSTRDMETEVREGRFRSELYYRLAGVCVQLPPLRQRREDIPLLVRYFLSKYARIFQRSEMELSNDVMQLLIEHPWPGNIRQLENVVKRVVALENEELGVAEIKVSQTVSRPAPVNVTPASLKVASRKASRQAERQLILQTLEKTHWNRKRAAEALQISYKSLLFKLKRIEMQESEEV